MMMFRNRKEAGKVLAEVLRKRGYQKPVVLGIPRGGVIIATEVARELDGDVGVAVARKLGAPGQPELGIGAVTADGTAWVDEHLAKMSGADRAYIEREVSAQVEEAKRREKVYDHRYQPALKGRTVLVVDDGLATGATARAALRAVRNAGASRVVLAVPVAPPHTVRELEDEADEVVAATVDEDFYAIGQFYLDFRPVSDDEVRQALEANSKRDRSISRREVTIPKGDLHLSARLLIPAGNGPFPCVVFVHGLGSDKDSPRNVPIAEHLLDAGIASLLFDLNGHGESPEDPKGRAAFPLDLQAAFAWAEAEPSIDNNRIGISGSSIGGVIAIEALRLGLVTPKTMVLRAPPVETNDFAGLETPVLVLCGQFDPLRRQIEEATAVTDAAILSVVPGAGHLFEEPGTLDEALARTVRWFEEWLAGTTSV
jgi:putative phosphoribosyl transferase